MVLSLYGEDDELDEAAQVQETERGNYVCYKTTQVCENHINKNIILVYGNKMQ